VLKAEGITRYSRLTLCDVTARTLEKGLALLGIAVPQRM
jgi:arginyl-tRNA synthetase